MSWRSSSPWWRGFGASDERVANSLYFAAWCAALLLLFSLGLRLPLHLRGGSARLATAGIVVAAAGVGLLANIALYRHDVHFDLTETAASPHRRNCRRSRAASIATSP